MQSETWDWRYDYEPLQTEPKPPRQIQYKQIPKVYLLAGYSHIKHWRSRTLRAVAAGRGKNLRRKT